MDLFIPNVVTVPPLYNNSTATNNSKTTDINPVAPSKGDEFKRVYLEELAKNCYQNNGDFGQLGKIARIHHEEYYGLGGYTVKRWKIYFQQYNVVVNLEENNGMLKVSSS